MIMHGFVIIARVGYKNNMHVKVGRGTFTNVGIQQIWMKSMVSHGRSSCRVTIAIRMIYLTLIV